MWLFNPPDNREVEVHWNTASDFTVLDRQGNELARFVGGVRSTGSVSHARTYAVRWWARNQNKITRKLAQLERARTRGDKL